MDGDNIYNGSARDFQKLRREKIGFIFQFLNLTPFLTAEANIVLPMDLAGMTRQKAHFRSITGKGVTASVEGRTVAVGSVELFEELAIDAGTLVKRSEELRRQSQIVMLVAIATNPLAWWESDPMKTSTPEAIRLLHAESISLVTLTGDKPDDRSGGGKHAWHRRHSGRRVVAAEGRNCPTDSILASRGCDGRRRIQQGHNLLSRHIRLQYPR